jgi:hypothetical protein
VVHKSKKPLSISLYPPAILAQKDPPQKENGIFFQKLDRSFKRSPEAMSKILQLNSSGYRKKSRVLHTPESRSCFYCPEEVRKIERGKV